MLPKSQENYDGKLRNGEAGVYSAETCNTLNSASIPRQRMVHITQQCRLCTFNERVARYFENYINCKISSLHGFYYSFIISRQVA